MRTEPVVSGPVLYGHVLRYQVTGTVPDGVPVSVVTFIRQLAVYPGLLAYLRQQYPDSRLEDYRAVARTVCQDLCAEEEVVRRAE